MGLSSVYLCQPIHQSISHSGLSPSIFQSCHLNTQVFHTDMKSDAQASQTRRMVMTFWLKTWSIETLKIPWSRPALKEVVTGCVILHRRSQVTGVGVIFACRSRASTLSGDSL